MNGSDWAGVVRPFSASASLIANVRDVLASGRLLIRCLRTANVTQTYLPSFARMMQKAASPITTAIAMIVDKISTVVAWPEFEVNIQLQNATVAISQKRALRFIERAA